MQLFLPYFTGRETEAHKSDKSCLLLCWRGKAGKIMWGFDILNQRFLCLWDITVDSGGSWSLPSRLQGTCVKFLWAHKCFAIRCAETWFSQTLCGYLSNSLWSPSLPPEECEPQDGNCWCMSVISHGCMGWSVKENLFESRSGLDRLMLYFAPQIAPARRKA